MSLAVVHSRALDALRSPQVTVEVHLANGLPSFAPGKKLLVSIFLELDISSAA